MVEENKQKEKAEEKKFELTAKKEGKKAEKEKNIRMKKKDKAVVRGRDLPISIKHSIAICKFIKGKKIEKAVSELEQVSRKEKAIPMKGELPHRKGKGMERGRYPVKASKIFIKLLRGLAANSVVNDLVEPYIAMAKADVASRPYRRFGQRRFKRTHVLLVAKERKKKEKEKLKERVKEKKPEKTEEKKELKEELVERAKEKEEKAEKKEAERKEEWQNVEFGFDVLSQQEKAVAKEKVGKEEK